MPKNTLVVIGFLGDKTAYLNMEPKEAIKRFDAEHPGWTVRQQRLDVKVVEFDDHFDTYEIQEKGTTYNVLANDL